MHLLNADKIRLSETIEALHNFQIDRFVPGHCSGWKALCEFSQAFRRQGHTTYGGMASHPVTRIVDNPTTLIITGINYRYRQ